MKHLALLGAATASLLALGNLAACGSSPAATGGQGGDASSSSSSGVGGAPTTSSSSGAATSSSGATTSSSSGATTSSSSGATTSSSSSTSSSSGSMTLPDPNLDGPYAIAELDDTIASVPGADKNVPVHCAYPTSGPSAGPYPVVVVGHGLQIAASQYTSYVKRLATFGYVALTVDFPASPFGTVDNPAIAKDMLAGIDWATGKPMLKADANTAGMSGHSLGGKVALLASTMDARVKASIVLDPVDGGGPFGCNPPACVNVAALMPNLHIPTGFIGETTDSGGGFMPCAPAAQNFQTFYAGTNSPSLSVTVTGANHVSFVDDLSTCGLACSFCQPATAPHMQVQDLARSYLVAFYERHLRGITGYDTYLTGAAAQTRYVTSGQATIQSK